MRIPISPNHSPHSTFKHFDLWHCIRYKVISWFELVLSYESGWAYSDLLISPVFVRIVVLPSSVFENKNNMHPLGSWIILSQCCQWHLAAVYKYSIILLWNSVERQGYFYYYSVRGALYFSSSRHLINTTIQHNLCSGKCLHFPLKWILVKTFLMIYIP